jgi:hypothetical protein
MRYLSTLTVFALALAGPVSNAAAAEFRNDCVQRDEVVCTSYLVPARLLANGQAVSIRVPGGLPPVDHVDVKEVPPGAPGGGDLEVLLYLAAPQDRTGAAL